MLLALGLLLSQDLGLKEIAARYAALTDYQVDVRTVVKSDFEGDETAKFDYSFAVREPHDWRIWQKSRTADRFELLLVANASEVWGYSPARKQFVAKSAARGREELAEIRRLHERFIGRFRLLDRMGVRVVSRRGGSVYLEPDSPKEGWNEELWIDPATKLVRKSRFRKRQPLPFTGWITTTTEWSRWRMTVDDSLFRFTPPVPAREVTSLEVR